MSTCSLHSCFDRQLQPFKDFRAMPHALIVGDDVTTREAIAALCVTAGFRVTYASCLGEVRTQIAHHPVDIVFVDLQLPEGSGLEIFSQLTSRDNTSVVIIAGNATLESAVESLRRGAVDYLTKPPDFQRLQLLLSQVTHRTGLRTDAGMTTSANRRIGHFGTMLGIAPVMQRLYHHIDRVAPTEATVLLLGESGTGKEIAAQTIHERSRRQHQPFLPVNCGAISPQLIESEIFGHEKGSFTGADRQHKGYFERANGGTLFLDEVTEMPLALQVKLLRVLETGTFMRIGSNQEIATDVRIIAASNRDPEQAITDGKLRLDLYHRLNVFPLVIPPLRERGADVLLLARLFLDALNASNGSAKTLSADAIASLAAYHWPGNVRELRNYVQRAFILSDDVIDATALAPAITTQSPSGLALAIPVGTSLAEVDRKLIFATLALCSGVKKHAADVLGISLKTLYNRLEEYGPEDAGRREDTARSQS